MAPHVVDALTALRGLEHGDDVTADFLQAAEV